MISFTGNGLNILIAANYNYHEEWQAFASWYSIHKMLPDAEVILGVSVSTPIIPTLFRWAIRANVRKHRFVDLGYMQLFASHAALASNTKQPLAVVTCGTMAVRELNLDFTDRFGVSKDRSVWLFNDMTIDNFKPAVNAFFNLYDEQKDSPVEEVIESIGGCEIDGLSCLCTENDHTTFVKVDTCGHYNKKSWLEQAKSSPFTHIRRLRKTNISLNENIVLGLWEQMQKTHTFMI